MKKEQILYLDCASGISGDMFAAAMLDLGADREALRRALDSLPLDGFRAEIGTVSKNAISCCDFRVILDRELDNHDADMEYLFGERHVHHHEACEQPYRHEGEAHERVHEGELHGHVHEACEQTHRHEEEAHTYIHEAEEQHAHHHETGAHVHRTLQDVRTILTACDMTPRAEALADHIFVCLAEAEAKAHGTTRDQVHFHEVGAVDSIVDIVTAAVCFDSLQVQRVFVSPLFEGSGTVRCAHGLLPIPVPAVSNILAGSSLRIAVDPETRGEFITPTGAAIAASIATEEQLPKQFMIDAVGLGAGKRTYERPNYLRAMLITSSEEAEEAPENLQADRIVKLETDIDDCSGEILGYVMDRLMEAGARDVHYLPVFMKKNRPAWQLQVICTEDRRQELEAIIFSETTSIGIRRARMERSTMPRTIRTVSTPFGAAEVKICMLGEIKKVFPEYESVKRIAGEQGLAFEEVFRIVRGCTEDEEN